MVFDDVFAEFLRGGFFELLAFFRRDVALIG